MVSQLDAINFQHEFNGRDADSAYEFFISTMKRLIEQNVPKVTIKKYTNKPEWWSPELQRLKNRRDKSSKRRNGVGSMVEYEAAQKAFSDENDRRHSEYIRLKQENIKSNPAEFWKFAKLTGGVERYPVEMHYGNRTGKSTEQIVDLFADYFESLYAHDETIWKFDDIYDPILGAEEISISLFDIEAAIHSLDWKSGARPDEIKPLVIKKCASTVAWPVWLLYQKCFDTGKIATRSKTSRIVPVYKRKGDKADIKNYRVIAIQSVVMKIHEMAVKRKMCEKMQPQRS